MTPQKETAIMLIKAGMTAEQAALYTALMEHLMQNSAEVSALIRLAQDSDDREYKEQVVKSLLGRVSEIILENPELIKEIVK